MSREKSLTESIAQIERLQQQFKHRQGLLVEKALLSNNPEDILKANDFAARFFNDINENKEQKSFLYDPFYQDTSSGYREKPVAMTERLLRRMSRSPIIKSIIGTRIEQVADFAKPQPDKYSTGFVIVPRKKINQDTDQKLTKEDKERIAYLTDFVINCGDSNVTWEGDDFDSFLRKVIADSLAMDKMTFEIIRDRRGKPVKYIAVDGATIKLALNTKDNYLNRIEKDGYMPAYCQVWDDQILTDFYPQELCFGIRNPTTDMRYNGYGISELEDLISTVTSMLWADQYNSNFFSQGSMPKGIMKVSGNVGQHKLNEFKQMWLSQVQGAQNSHRTPMIEADKFDYIDLHKNNSDMEFEKYKEYLIKVGCAVYKIDPSEIGFPMNNGGKATFNSGNNEEKISYSRDKGLKPLLKFVQNKMNKYVIWQLDPNYEFKFVGLDTETESQEEERIVKAVASYMEINEARKMKGLPPKPEYDIIANPVVQQAKMLAMQGNPNSNSFINKDADDQDNTQKAEINPFVKDLELFLEREFAA